MNRLRRFASTSFSLNGATDTSDSKSIASTPSVTDSSLADALSSPLLPPPVDTRALAHTSLVTTLEALQTVPRAAYSHRLVLIARIQQTLTEEPDTRNTFREQGGFLSAVSILASLEEAAVGDAVGEEADSIETRAELRYELVKLVFAIIALACTGHDFNRVAFAETVGFEAMGESIKLSGLMGSQSRVPEGDHGDATASPAEKLLSILYAFLTGDFSSPPLFTHLRLQLDSPAPVTTDLLSSRSPCGPADIAPPIAPRPSLESLIDSHLVDRFTTNETEVAQNPAVVPLLFELQAALSDDERSLSYMVLSSLRHLAESSTRSQVALSEVGVVGIVLERLFPLRKEGARVVESVEREVLKGLLKRLLEMGAGTTEIRTMFERVVEGRRVEGDERLNEEMLELILDGVRKSRYPSFIHFDLSLHGHSSLSLRSLGRPFPPPTHGYTCLAWLLIEHPPSDADEKLVIFGCGDATGKCHLELTLNPDLHLCLSTSLAKPPITFSTFTFKLGRFYHLAVVHQRPKYSFNSPVSLYVDGKLVEVSRAAYPVAPPKDWEVQGWLGTPKDRVPAGRLGKGRSEMKWDLGPTWLVHGDVPEEMIYVCATLGPRYAANFQDQLGQFQTNKTSTLLNVRLDALARDSPSSSKLHANSPLVHAIRDKGAAVIPEHRIYFAFSALNTLVTGSPRGLSGSGLSAHAQQALALATASRGKVVINSAIPKVEEALVQPHGLGHLDGDPCIAIPQGLDVAIWKIGGVAVALRLVELARTGKQLTMAVELFVELVSESWRNAEDTERMQGYEILALLLKAKAGIVRAETHDAIMAFVGYDFKEPCKSVVSNPLAFRFLVLDFGLWSVMEPAIQWAHFARLKEFVQRSEHRDFNTRRLAKMHLTRKILYALRASYYDPAMLTEVVDTLMLVVGAHFTTETVRHIATFLTATLCQVLEPNAAPLSSVVPNGTRTLPDPLPAVVDPSTSFVLDASQVDRGACRSSLRVMQDLHDILLAPNRKQDLDKFAKIITTKWMLLFLLDTHTHPFAAVLALRILVRVLQSQGPAFVAKFGNLTDGFSVMRVAIPHLWNFGQVQLALFALLHGKDIATLPLDAPFEATTFVSSDIEGSKPAPEAVRIVIACLGKGLKVLSTSQDVVVTKGIPSVAISGPDGIGATTPLATAKGATLSLEDGFEIVVDLLSKANQSTGSGSHLVTSPVPLQDFASILRPFLLLSTPADLPSSISPPPLPILSSRKNYRLRPDPIPSLPPPPPASPPPKIHAGAVSTPKSPRKLRIPALVEYFDKLAASPLNSPPLISPPLMALPKGDSFQAPLREKKISKAATSLLNFLSHQVSDGITSRLVHRRTRSGVDLSLSPETDPSLQLLRDIFAAAASSEMEEQVAFRTLLLKNVAHLLARASSASPATNKIASFVELATNQSFEGWNVDLRELLDFILLYIEKQTSLDVLSSGDTPAATLFKSLNRLILLALLQEHEIPGVLSILVRHQLSVFAAQNTDPAFFRSLLHRLNAILQSSSSPFVISAVIDFYKLLILQRPADAEAAMGQSRGHESEASLVGKLIDADVSAFLGLLEDRQAVLDKLAGSWTKFVKAEVEIAQRAVELEHSRLEDFAKSAKSKKDLQRRRTRKHRTAIYDWSEGIHDVESTRVAHTRQDIADHATFVQMKWQEQTQNFQRECGIWGDPAAERRWRLDFTEGHCRMRKKLLADASRRPQQNLELASHPHDQQSRSLGPSRHESLTTHSKLQIDSGASPLPSPISPEEDQIWSEAFAPPADAPDSEADPQAVVDEDKNRKVRRSLEPSDVILSVFNISRIVGLDACPGLLLLAKKNVYIIDNFFQRQNGELIDAWDAPEEERDQHLQTLSDLAGRDSKTASADLDTAHRSRRWTWADLKEVHERKYLFRKVALELFFADGRSFLVTFAKDQRAHAFDLIATRSPEAVASGSLNVAGTTLGSKFSDVVRGQRTKLEQMTKRWERREMSNFDYLMFLNTCAGRTYNDLTNYPIFPWILSDYSSETLDLSQASTFRDLSKPMGAQTEERKGSFERPFRPARADFGGPLSGVPGQYSSAMIVVGYMLRLRPFTESYLDLQGGTFDHADRMFWSIPKAWESCSRQSRSDVRELIPEFFYLPDFLRNSNDLDLGIRQDGQERIDNVELPPWAKGDPRLFVELHREALESEHVSLHLGKWIDLIFGFRQTGDAATESCNVFHHLSYEGAIDLDTIEDANERKAATSTIHNFGTCPSKLFSKPHPQRPPPLVSRSTHPLFSSDLAVEQQYLTLIQSIVPVSSSPSQVSRIYPSTPDKTFVTSSQTLLIPGHPGHSISWGYADQTVRLHARGNSLPVTVFEHMHSEFVSAACFADAGVFVTGSTDTNVSLWKWRWRAHGKEGHFQQLECLRGHSNQVTCVAASREFSIIVSGSEDRSAIVWDLNRRRFVHRLEGHEAAVQLVAISETTGDVVTCSAAVLRVWSVNGVLLATQPTSNFVDPITAVAWSLSETSPIIATGHRNGRIILWQRVPAPTLTGWKLEQLHVLAHKDRLFHRPCSASADITSLAFTPRTLYSGDALGRLYLWSPPGTELFLPDSSNGGACMACGSGFGLLESRRRCAGCAGIFCGLDSTTSIEVGGRFCGSCFSKLSPLMVLGMK